MELVENIDELKNPKLRLDEITVCGVKLGDPSDKIPSTIIDEGPYQGWFHTSKGVAIRTTINDFPKIVEFLFKPVLLNKLNLKKKRNILETFGIPHVIEKQRGSTYYFYPNRKLIIAWNNKDDKIFGIYLGEHIIKQTVYKIKDLLDKFFEFKAMVPNVNSWNLISLQDNEPRYYRLKELLSLIKAFEIGDDLYNDLQNTGFLERRTILDLEPILKDIESYALSDKFESEKFKQESKRFTNVVRFKMLIQAFMRFSEAMRSVLAFNSSWLMTGSVTARYSIHKTQKLLNKIDLSELKEIDYFLCKILDPKDKVFTKYELIKNYNFPDVDLASIDMDNH